MARRGLGLSLLLVALASVGAASACGDATTPAPARVAAPATQAEAPAHSPPATPTDPAPTADAGPGDGVVAFTLDGAPRRFAVAEPHHATFNPLLTPPAVTVIARADAATKELLTLKIGGVDLARATLPLELRELPHEAGAPVITMTYTDPAGARHEARVEEATPTTTLTLDAWDPTSRRLRGRFSADTRGADGSAHQLRGGAFEATLVDPFAARPTPGG
ncbi:MAG: hypothetical protein R3B09_15035 [Nannocystaceae bacterium]